ncbi:MAG: mannose-6-phosphate isomerase [Bacteroidetes bacterium]|nr:MAG: mannose-6-phosphate isomerase [Bacteroidota bacterium]
MSNKKLYPFKFNPILKPTIWGGNKLVSVLGKPDLGQELIGESWEISGVKNNISVVESGDLTGNSLTDLIKTYKSDLLGKKVYKKFGEDFPLLIKFIDANQDLSIQVHPDDNLAKQRHDSFGKTEMWYVVDAEEKATLISGFKKATNRQEYLQYFNSGRVTELLNYEEVNKDDVYFLPAGRVHTIGKGLLIAEIQQTSDITYRIYDFDRVDKDGNTRQLHVDEALDAIDFNYYDDYKTSYRKEGDESLLVSCDYFIVNCLQVDSKSNRDYNSIDSFVVLMFIEGCGVIEYSEGSVHYAKGDTFLIPAMMENVSIIPDSASKLLEVYLPS